MAAEIITAAVPGLPLAAGAAGQGGSLAAVTGAAKAFVALHPIGVAVTSGAVLGMGTYYLLGKIFGKKKSVQPAAA
jgi:membrane protein DedA with SNARE-associated domain